MAQNRAAQNLSYLQQAAQAAQSGAPQAPAHFVDNPQINQWFFEELGSGSDGQAREPIDPEDVGFNKKAEGFVTAIVGTALLGPLAGVALGAAQTIIGRKEDQQQAARYEDQFKTFAAADEIFQGELDRMWLGAESVADREQISTLETSKNAAIRMLQSPSPVIQQEGAKMLAEFNTNMQAFEVRNEAEEIAKTEQEDEIKRNLEGENYTRYTDLRDNFTAESEGYLAVQGAVSTLDKALNLGTPVSIYGSIKLLEKALDPNSVVRPEEQEAWGQLGSVFDQVDVLIQRLQSGKPLLPEQIDQIKDLASVILDGVYEMQVARETRFADEIDDIELPAKYHNNFQLAEVWIPDIETDSEGNPNLSRLSNQQLKRLIDGRR